jgi:hypothetical protein
MKDWIRKFSLRIWNKIQDHLAKYTAGGIIVIIVVLCIASWKWLINKYTFELYDGGQNGNQNQNLSMMNQVEI